MAYTTGFYLFVDLFEELEFVLECLSSVLGVNVQQRLVVQILYIHSHHNN